MQTFSINNVRDFMHALLTKDTFDDFYAKNADISTFTNFSIDCRFNEDFYTEDELLISEHPKTILWKDIKKHCFDIIKGNKLPLSFKIVLAANDTLFSRLISKNMVNVNGLYINIRYTKGNLTVTSGVSLTTFSMDKSGEEAWDAYLKEFLLNWL